MITISSFPNELQFYIMKYLSYSPSSVLIKSNQTYILNKQIYYHYIDNRFDIFNTNDNVKTERIFQQCIMDYIKITKKYPRLSDSNTLQCRQEFFKDKLKKLLKIIQKTI